MNTVTWEPGTQKDLDELFEHLRQEQYNDRSHRLWQNYSRDFLKYTVALTICFNQDKQPLMCSSISTRDCWPTGSFRILNRLWKVQDRKTAIPKVMSPSFYYSALSQVEWLNKNADCKLYFISRETDKWEAAGLRHFARYNMHFDIAPGRFLTCPNEEDTRCWQKIIYNGSQEILGKWKQKP